MPRFWRAVIFFAILVSTTGFDYGTKEWARSSLPVEPAGCVVPHCRGIPQPVVDGFWDWELAYNTGAAFSSLRGATVVLSLVAGLALVVLGVMAARSRPEQRLRRVALAMIAGGAIGNLIDRLRDGAVTDFVRWKIGEHAWPIFNAADVALVSGILLLAIDGYLERRPAPA